MSLYLYQLRLANQSECSTNISLLSFLFSTLQKLHAIQQSLVWKEEGLYGKKVYSVFDRPNLEHIHSLKRFVSRVFFTMLSAALFIYISCVIMVCIFRFFYGQVSVEYLQYALACSQGATDKYLFSESGKLISQYR